MLSETQFNAAFEVIPNRADGNCFFESMEYLLADTCYARENGAVPTAGEIREMVGNFYRDFDRDLTYPEHTIEYTIKLGLLYDNEDEEMGHDYNIWNDYVWASMTDVLVCALLFEVNIYLYKKVGDLYHSENITHQYSFPDSIDILYNGVNHFEAIIQK